MRDFDLCKLVISDDNLYASVVAEVGTVLSASDVKRALMKAGVVGAYPDEQIEMLLDASAPGEPVLVAAGTPPQLGVDARIEYFFDTERRGHRALSDYENFDWREVRDRSFVKVGAVLARKHLPTRGVDGRDLFGQRVIARHGEDIPLVCGENVAFGPDGRTLVARKAGIARLGEGGAVSIADVISVQDVDLSTGSICTLGAVVVDGNVTEGFVVEAAGDVYVRGNVEAATVSAGGRVIVGGGLRHHAKIEAVGDVAVRFVDPECSVQTLGELVVVASSVGAQLSALGHVAVGDEIAGGRVESATHITCKRAGSEAGVRTLFVIGNGPTAETIAMAKRDLGAIERRLGRAPSHEDDIEVSSLKTPPLPGASSRGTPSGTMREAPLRPGGNAVRPSSLPPRPQPSASRSASQPLPSPAVPPPPQGSAGSLSGRPGSLPARPASLPAMASRPALAPRVSGRAGSLPSLPAGPRSVPVRPSAPTMSSGRMPVANGRPSQQLLTKPSAAALRTTASARVPEAAVTEAKRGFQLEYQLLATERQIAFHEERGKLPEAHVPFVAATEIAHAGVVVRIDREERTLDEGRTSVRFVLVDGAMTPLPFEADHRLTATPSTRASGLTSDDA